MYLILEPRHGDEPTPALPAGMGASDHAGEVASPSHPERCGGRHTKAASSFSQGDHVGVGAHVHAPCYHQVRSCLYERCAGLSPGKTRRLLDSGIDRHVRSTTEPICSAKRKNPEMLTAALSLLLDDLPYLAPQEREVLFRALMWPVWPAQVELHLASIGPDAVSRGGGNSR